MGLAVFYDARGEYLSIHQKQGARTGEVASFFRIVFVKIPAFSATLMWIPDFINRVLLSVFGIKQDAVVGKL